MVDIFSKEEFENALPIHCETGKALWEHIGIIQGEHAYRIKIDSGVAIEIRSSVSSSGMSAKSGKDSIRAWLVAANGQPLGSKVSKYTTRRKGWEDRLKDVLRTLWGWRRKAGNCPICDEPKKIFKVRKEGPNKGRVFCNCDSCSNQFVWLTNQK